MTKNEFIDKRKKFGRLYPAIYILGMALTVGIPYLAMLLFGKGFLKDFPPYLKLVAFVLFISTIFLAGGFSLG